MFIIRGPGPLGGTLIRVVILTLVYSGSHYVRTSLGHVLPPCPGGCYLSSLATTCSWSSRWRSDRSQRWFRNFLVKQTFDWVVFGHAMAVWKALRISGGCCPFHSFPRPTGSWWRRVPLESCLLVHCGAFRERSSRWRSVSPGRALQSRWRRGRGHKRLIDVSNTIGSQKEEATEIRHHSKA